VAKRASLKRAGGKRATATRSAAKRSAAKRPAARRSTKKAASNTRRGTTRGGKQTKTARRKNVARSVASRSTRKKTAPRAKSRLGSTATAVAGALAGAVAAVTDRLPWASGEPDALTLLETDHRRLESLLARGEDTTERAVKGRTELLHTLTAELNVHELIEEKVLYPALKIHPTAKDVVLEGYQEHHVADLLVNELHRLAKDNEQWGAKFKVLKENIEHHIEEEEGIMFKAARAVMSREELQQLGAQMAEMKAESRRATGSP
jgi:hypothetical protein